MGNRKCEAENDKPVISDGSTSVFDLAFPVFGFRFVIRQPRLENIDTPFRGNDERREVPIFIDLRASVCLMATRW